VIDEDSTLWLHDLPAGGSAEDDATRRLRDLVVPVTHPNAAHDIDRNIDQ
jgi:hypothetical protein